MTLRRLRPLTFVTPVVIVLTLEILRTFTIGVTSFRTRLILDGLVAVAFVIFGAVMVRAISEAGKRKRRQNAELRALHGAALNVTAELSLGWSSLVAGSIPPPQPIESMISPLP